MRLGHEGTRLDLAPASCTHASAFVWCEPQTKTFLGLDSAHDIVVAKLFAATMSVIACGPLRRGCWRVMVSSHVVMSHHK